MERGAPQAILDCSDGETLVDSSQVLVDAEGLHIGVRGGRVGQRVFVDPAPGSHPGDGIPKVTYLTHEVGGIAMARIAGIPLGDVRVRCVTDGGSPGSTIIRLVETPDSSQWDSGAIACERADARIPARRMTRPFDISSNPLPEALFRAIAGVQPTDRIEGLTGWARDASSPWGYVTRNGQDIAYFETSRYANMLFVTFLITCPGTGIGAEPKQHALFAGKALLGTPYTLGAPRCDPYTSECRALKVTAAWYERRTGESVRLHAPIPEAACLPSQPFGCPPPPDDAVIDVLVTPTRFDVFVNRRGCGATSKDPCV